MKTAKEWDLAFERLGSSKSAYFSRKDIIQQIQLDAMKEGARRAAVKAGDHNALSPDGIVWHTKQSVKESILTTAEQWTEKDL